MPDLRDINGNTKLFEAFAAADRTADTDGADFDMSECPEEAVAVLDVGSLGTNQTLDVKFQSAQSTERGSLDSTPTGDSDTVLRNGSSDNVELAAQFSQSGARSVKHVYAKLKKVGSPSGDVWVEIQGDSSGSPDGTAIGTSQKVAAGDVSTSYEWVKFTFTTPVDLSDATTYHAVLTGDYALSASDHVTLHTETGISGGNVEIKDASWSDDTAKNFLVYIEEYNFADVGVSFSQASSAGQEKVRLTGFNQNVRAVATLNNSNSAVFACVVLGVDKAV